MHDVVARENLKGLYDLLEVVQSAFFGEGSLLLHQFVQSAAVAVLVDEVEVVGSFEHVDVLDDVLVLLDVGEDVDLGLSG